MLVLELLTTWKAYSHKVLVKKKNMNEVAHKIQRTVQNSLRL